MRLTVQFLIAAGLLLSVICVTEQQVLEVLANSSYPCVGGNAQRTYKIDRNFHCPAISGGRSTVLNVAWIWPPDEFVFNFTSTEITNDEEGFLYVQGLDLSGYLILRVHFANGTLSTSDSGYRPTSSATQASLTHVAGGFMYMGSASHSEYVQESDMTGFVTATNPNPVNQPASYVPFDKWMVKTNVGLISAVNPSVVYWDSSVHLFDTNPPNFAPGRPVDVVIGSNATNQFIIVVADRSPIAEYPIYAVGKAYSNRLGSPPVRAWFEDNSLFVMATEDFLILDWESGNSTQYSMLGYTDQTNTPFTGYYIMYHSGKSFVHYYFNSTRAEFVDRVNFDTLTDTPAPYLQKPPIAQPIFSKRDNMVFYPKGVTNGNVYFEGRQWGGTWDVKVTGKLPKGITLTEDHTVTGVPLYGDNCDIAVVHQNKLYGLRPLPIQDVVPIFECYNPDTGIAFFSYNNLEQNPFSIPLTQDRNSFTPYSTPIEDFEVGRGPIYPFSAPLDIGKNLRGYRYWMLERYTVPISFDDSSIFCPTTINIIIRLLANEPFPSGFNLIVAAKFVEVTGVSSDRVTVVAKKRNLNQLDSTLEVELSIAPDETNVEQKPAEIVQDFVSNQQQTFTEQVNNDANAPQNVTLDSVTGKELDTQIVGVRDYVPPPMSPNVNSPSSPNQPGTAGPGATSAARPFVSSTFVYYMLVIAAAICLVH